MDVSGVTETGLKELSHAANVLPAQVESRLRALAFIKANRVAARIRSAARSLGWHQIPNEVTVRDGNEPGRVIPGSMSSAKQELARAGAETKAFIVEVQPVFPRPANLALWLEFGTVNMTGRPFILPSADAERASYAAEQEAAIQELFDQTVNR